MAMWVMEKFGGSSKHFVKGKKKVKSIYLSVLMYTKNMFKKAEDSLKMNWIWLHTQSKKLYIPREIILASICCITISLLSSEVFCFILSCFYFQEGVGRCLTGHGKIMFLVCSNKTKIPLPGWLLNNVWYFQNITPMLYNQIPISPDFNFN